MRSPADEVRAVVIGIGNPLRGDDAFGWLASEAVAVHPDPRVEVLHCIQLVPELASTLARAGFAVFIDASVSWPAGRIACERVAEPSAGASMTHHVTPQTLVSLARTVCGAPVEAWLLSVGAEKLGYEEGLSDSVQAALPAVVQSARQLIERRLHDCGQAVGRFGQA